MFEEPDIEISNVSFLEGMVNIQYSEAREQNKAVAMVRGITLDAQYVQDELDAVLDALQDLVDKGLLLLRNPPKRVRRDNVEADPILDSPEDAPDGD